jgi:hypothetical protein
MRGHFVVLSHQEGDAWDNVVITHLGIKTVEAADNPAPPDKRDLSDWHNDTFVNGPSWDEFTRAMALRATPRARVPAQFTLFPQFPFRKKFVIARARSPVEVTAIDANRPGGSGESPLSVLYCVRALPGNRPSENGKRIRTSARDRSRRARKRLHRRRRIPLRHGTGTLKRNGRGAVGRDLFLRSAARGGTAVLGRVFRAS